MSHRADDPNARKARVDSLSSPPAIEFLNAKISNANSTSEANFVTFGQKLIE